MKTAQEIMSKDVATIHPHAPVAEAIRRMRERQVGSLLVEKVSVFVGHVGHNYPE
jgi:CBS domain-containing protein